MQQRVRDGALRQVVDPLPAAALGADDLAVSSSHSTAIFVSDQSHHWPPFLAPPSSVAVSGPSARSWSTTGRSAPGPPGRVQRWPRARQARRRKAKCGHSSMGRMQAACDQYSKAWPPVQYADSTVSRPTAPSRAYGISSCERASTEIVSSCTAPSVAQHAAHPGRAGPGRRAAPGRAGRSGGPRRRRGRDRGGSRHAAHDRGATDNGIRPTAPDRFGDARPRPTAVRLPHAGGRPRPDRAGRYGVADRQPQSEGSSAAIQRPAGCRGARSGPQRPLDHEAQPFGAPRGSPVADLGAPLQPLHAQRGEGPAGHGARRPPSCSRLPRCSFAVQ